VFSPGFDFHITATSKISQELILPWGWGFRIWRNETFVLNSSGKFLNERNMIPIPMGKMNPVELVLTLGEHRFDGVYLASEVEMKTICGGDFSGPLSLSNIPNCKLRRRGGRDPQTAAKKPSRHWISDIETASENEMHIGWPPRKAKTQTTVDLKLEKAKPTDWARPKDGLPKRGLRVENSSPGLRRVLSPAG
jgi:hypothetical protein